MTKPKRWDPRKKQTPWDQAKGTFQSSFPEADVALYHAAHLITDSQITSLVLLVRAYKAALARGEVDPKFTARRLGRAGASMDMLSMNQVRGFRDTRNLHRPSHLISHVWSGREGVTVYWPNPLGVALVEHLETFYPERVAQNLPPREFAAKDTNNLRTGKEAVITFTYPDDAPFLFIGVNDGVMIQKMLVIDDTTAPVLRQALELYMTRPEKAA